MKKKLAIVTTHPIQYNAPWYKLITKRGNIELKVFYTWSQSEQGNKYDPGFQQNIEWDIPLLEGYAYEFIENTSEKPGTRNYRGIKNPGLIAAVKKYSPDALFVTGWNFDSHLKCLRYFHKKIPVFFRGDSTMLDAQSGLKALLRRLILSTVFRYIDIAFYVGSQNKKYFTTHRLKENELVFAPHAIDNDRFAKNDAALEKARRMRQTLGIASSSPIFLFAGKLESKKDPLLLAEAFSEIAVKDAQLVFVGNGMLEEELKKKYGTGTNIHFMNFQNQQNMPAVYQMADVFVLPSKGPGETWGLAINEAMASGKAVIASNKCGGAVDLIKSGENGFIFESGNKEDLKKYLLQFISHHDMADRFGKMSLQLIKQFSFDHIADAIEHEMQQINRKA